MQGILVMDKPAGFTSFDVDAKLRGILGTRKIGHAGTLDPMATGVLPVFVGRAAKAVDMLPDTDKTYEATLRLGLRTNTGDITGQVLETAPVPAGLDETALCAVLGRFLGRSMQTPPMYSAVKVGGQPLYKLARKGKTVARPARPSSSTPCSCWGVKARRTFACASCAAKALMCACCWRILAGPWVCLPPWRRCAARPRQAIPRPRP